MAGLTGHQTVVDVVAASEKLRPSITPGITAAEGEAGVCMLGHLNPAGTRFCGQCGLEIAARGPAASFSAERERPKPAAELTPEEKAERERQHAAALAAARRFEQAVPQFVPTEGEAVLIHFVADGFTAFGQVWFLGQELEIGPDHPRWAEARRWITMSRFEQIERYGGHKFDPGPWPAASSA
jgi:hypothetical protein